MGVENALPTVTSFTLGVEYAHAGTLDLNGFNQTVTSLKTDSFTNSAARIITSATAATLTVEQTANTTFQGQFTGALALNKKGTGTLSLNSDNLHTGDTVLSAGAILLNNLASTTQTGTVNTTAPVGTATTTSSGTVTNLNAADIAKLVIGQPISGTGIPSGAWVASISGTTVTIKFPASATVAASTSATVTFGALNGSLKNSTLDYQGGNLRFGITTTSATLGGLKGTQTLVLNNTATAPAAVALTVGGNNQSNSYTGVLSGAGSIAKTGTGTWSVGGANTYTGGTSVTAGTFLATNTTGSATGTGSVNVTNAGSKIGGTGSITGGTSQSINLNAGTFLQVGNSHGVNAGGAQDLALGTLGTPTNVDINLYGTLQFDLFGNDGAAITNPLGENDLLKIVSSTAADFTGSILDVSAAAYLSPVWTLGDTWKLIDWTDTSFTGAPVLGGNMPTLTTGLMWESYTNATGFFIRIAAVPEPSRALLIIFAGTFCMLRRRRA